MLKNHFKIAIRTLLRNKLRTTIHVLGLSIGISICFLIFNVIIHAYSFDNFHPEGEFIYRVNTSTEWEPGVPLTHAGVPGPLGDVIEEEMAGIEMKGRVYSLDDVMVVVPESNRLLGRSNTVTFADAGFLEVFPRQWLAGDPYSALNAPARAVITETSMKKYFPGLAPHEVLGKELLWIDADSIYAEVHGIVADFEENTDIIFTDFISISTIKHNNKEDWYGIHSWSSINSNSQLFIKSKTAIAALTTGLNEIAQKYFMEEDWNTITFTLEPLSEIHFSHNFNDSTVSRSYLRALLLICVIIMALACLNFINLETAQAISRAKEVGIRKTIGSSKGQLVTQFLGETFTLVVISCAISLVFADAFQKVFSEYLPAGFDIAFFSLYNLAFFAGISIVVTFLSGIYPSLILANYRPQRALKGEVNHVGGFSVGVFLRKNLTVVQFATSITFIIMVAILSNQMKYVSNRPLGFEKEAVLYAQLPFMSDMDKMLQFQNRVNNESFVQSASLGNSLVSSRGLWTSDVQLALDTTESRFTVQVMNVDSAFFKTNSIKIIGGSVPHNNATEIMVNRRFVQEMGVDMQDQVLGVEVRQGGEQKRIVGIVENFHSRTLKENIRPMLLVYSPQYFQYLTVKVHPDQNLAFAKSALESFHKEFYPNEINEFQFLDEVVATLYEKDLRIKYILGFASGLAILISVLGLFGLSSFTIAQRSKEISIRKVLGASLVQLLMLISKQYVLLVSIAFLIAIYPAYYFSNQWLSAFAYRIAMPYQVYFGVGFCVLLLALLVVGGHSIATARTNPAKILKDE